MTTAFSAITAALATLMGDAPAVANKIARARTLPMAAENDTMVVVRIGGTEGDGYAMEGAPVNWDTTFTLECYARSATLTPDVAVDALLQDVFARLKTDETLGGLVQGWKPQSSIEWDFDTKGDRVGYAAITLTAMHRTSAGVIT